MNRENVVLSGGNYRSSRVQIGQLGVYTTKPVCLHKALWLPENPVDSKKKKSYPKGNEGQWKLDVGRCHLKFRSS